MYAINLARKFTLLAVLLLAPLAGTALAFFAPSMPESEKIIFLGVGLLVLSFWVRKRLSEQAGSTAK